ncbi:hypothetical protein LTR86_007002 [Recurvomyces mirabilis]|nr:hypothetical protein LTR86_007002 [Recurvomyces mirabilis]
MAPTTALIIGATGFVGGHLCELLAMKHPQLRLLCLMRDTTPRKVSDLKKLNPSVEIVEGTLEDSEIISAAAEKVDVVIHVAHSDHATSVQAVLAGLRKRASTGSHRTPIYLHMSGLGVIADNVRGEKVDSVKEWTDAGFQLDDCPSDNTHLASDRQILEAGSTSQDCIQTAILFPGLIYGQGKTPRSGAWVPFYSTFAKAAGHAGTWGPGEVSQYCIHVRDVAAAVLCVLEYLLEDATRGGSDGLCKQIQPDDYLTRKLIGDAVFVTSQEPTMSWREINSVLGDVRIVAQQHTHLVF